MVNAPEASAQAAEPLESATLLVLSDSQEHAEIIESHLRNAAHRVRAVWIADVKELEARLLKSPVPDALMVSTRDAALLKDAVEICRRRTPGVPVLALVDQLSIESSQAAIAAGARDLVCAEGAAALKHLEKIWLREYAQHRTLRNLAETRARLADFESRYSQLVSATGDAVARIQEGILSQANPAMVKLLGYASDEELSGQTLMDLVAAEHRAAIKELLRKLQRGKSLSDELDCRLLHRDGNKIDTRIQLTRADAGADPAVELLIRAGSSGSVGNDGGPGGRLAFFEALSGLAHGSGIHAALFVLVDGFGTLEERVGYDEAERIFLQVGAVLRTRLQASDQLFRFSTHEFAMIVGSDPQRLADTQRLAEAQRLSDPEQARESERAIELERLADKLSAEIAGQVFSTAHHEAQLTVTVVVYPLTESDRPAEVMSEIVREARTLSARGGNRSAVLGPTARASVEEQEAERTAESVKRALRDGRLTLAYQTIASLEGDPREHFDVLVRMIDESGQEILAADFIGAAEKFGLLKAIDRWVIGRVLTVLESRVQRQDASMLFVKLSEDTLKESESFLAWLNGLIKARPLHDHELCFEIRETVLERHIRKAKVLTKVLRDLNAQIGIEHFGVGVNSIQLLDQLPAGFLKFHRSFTDNFTDVPVRRKMSKLMEVAKQRNIRTIVSHVEDANVMAGMWQMGVNYVQGFHIREPEVVSLAASMRLK